MAFEEMMVKMGLDAKAFQRGLTSVKSQIKDLGTEKFSDFKKAFTVAAIVEGVRELSKSMVELRRSAEDKGVSTDFLQGFQNATKKFGGTTEDADMAIDKLLIKIGQAREEGGAAADSFKQFGIALKDSEGFASTTEEILRQIADKYKNSADAASKAALANEFFSKSGLRINNVLDLGSRGLDDYIQNQKEAGKIIDSKGVDDLADSYLDVVNALTKAKGVSASFFGSMLGSVKDGIAFLGAYSTKLSTGITIEQAAKDAFESRTAKSKEETRAKVEQTRKNIEEIAKLTKEYAAELEKVEASAGKFAINDALSEELKKRLKLASMSEGDSRRVGIEKQIVALVEKRSSVELSTKQEELRALNEKAGEIEQEILGLGFDSDNKVEKEKKRVELAKMLKDIADKTNDIEKEKLEILKQQAQAVEKNVSTTDALKKAKSEQTKYTLEELATGNPRGVWSNKLRSDMFLAQKAFALEKRAEWIHEKIGNPELEEKLREQARALRGQIGSLKADERFPFKNLEESQKDAAQSLKEINAAAKGKGIKVEPVLTT